MPGDSILDKSNRNIIIICILVLIVIVYYFTSYKNSYKMTKYRSDIDDNMYVVRDMSDKQKASNMLARLKKNIFTITDYLVTNQDKYPEMQQYITQLNTNIRQVDISETDGTSEYTSYSVNKGEEMVYCLRSKKPTRTDQIHDLNLVMYVTLHEMAHVACPEYGHTKLFNEIFAFLANTAVQLKLYNKVSYDIDPHEYCGILITSSII